MSQLQADVKTVPDPVSRGDSPEQAGATSTSNPIQIGPDEPFFQFYPDDYWSAVAELDIDGSREIAATPAEKRFSQAFALMAAGEYERAEDIFTELSGEREDLTVELTAKNLLAMTLLYEHKWDRLEGLHREWNLSAEDRGNISALDWGAAFSNATVPAIFLPDSPVVIPLQLTVVGTPTIRVGINGKHYTFWLDTGSSITVLSSSVAADAHVMPLNGDTLTVGTFNGVAKVRPAVVDHLEIGQLVIANSPAIIMDQDLMKLHATGDGIPPGGLQVAGIIGWDVIRKFDIAMNYRTGEVVFRRPRDLRTRGTAAQNLIWAGRPFVAVHARYAGELHFTLDTGAQSSFIDDAAIAKLRLNAVATTTRAYGIGRSGGNTVRVIRQAKLNIAGRSLSMKDLIVNDQPPTGMINSDGILGSDIAQYGTMRIDATNGLFSIGVD